MADQSLLARLGFRLGTLGTTANLAIAAPLANGDYNPAAHTDANRLGFAFDRTPGSTGIDVVINGVQAFRMDEDQLTAVFGTESQPTYSFVGDANSGMYRVSADVLGFATDSTLRLSVSGAGVVGTVPVFVPMGSVSNPTYTFTGDPDTGMYSAGANELNFTTAGVQRVWMDNSLFELVGPGGGSSYVDYSFTDGFLQVYGAAVTAAANLMEVIDDYGTNTTNYALLVQSDASNGLYVHSLESDGTGQIALRTLSQFGEGVALSAETAGGGGTAAVIQILDGRGTQGLSIDASGAGAALFVGTSLDPVAANPGGATTLWSNSGDGNALYYGASPVGGSGGTPGGANTNVQFNNAGSFGGSNDFTWDGTDLIVNANVNGNTFFAQNDGSAGSPAYGFSSSTTGMWYDSAEQRLHFDIDGSSNVYFHSSGTLYLGNSGGGGTVQEGSIFFDTTTLYAFIDGTTYDLLAGGAAPGGSAGEFQFNDFGSFGGVFTTQFDNGTGAITLSNWGSPSVGLYIIGDSDNVTDEIVTIEAGSGFTTDITLLRLVSQNTNVSIGLDIIMPNAGDQAILATGGNISVNGGFLEVTEDTTGPGLRGIAQTTTGIRWTSTPTLEFVVNNTTIAEATSAEFTVNGKLTVTGLIDPTGLQFDPVGANPGDANTLWVNSGDGNALYFGASAVGGGASFPLLAPDGTGAAPSYSFTNDTDTGLFLAAVGTLSLSVGGSPRMNLTNSLLATSVIIQTPGGSAAAPAYSFSGDTDTGFYNGSANTINWAIGGVNFGRFYSTGIEILAPSVLVDTTGTAAAPAFTFTGDTNTGMYRDSADVLAFSTGGTQKLFMNTVFVQATVPIRGPTGSSGSPSFAFQSDGNSGLYSIADDQMALSTGGNNRITIVNTSVTMGVPVLAASGSAAAPGYAFSADAGNDSGMYLISADSIGFSTGANLRLTVNGTGITGAVPLIGPAATTLIASIRLPHGVAPSSPTDGDMWTTTTGLFVRLNGVTQNVGTVTGTGVSGQVSYWNGTGSQTGSANLTFDGTNLTTAGIHFVASGTAAAPTYSFTGDTDTGVYLSGTNAISLATGGAQRFQISTTAVITLLPIFSSSAGSAAAPVFSFQSDSNTGLYSVGADQLGITAGGALRLTVSNTALTSTVPIVAPAATTSATSLNVPHGTAPSAPTNGDFWSTTTGFFGRVNGSTVQFATGSGFVTGSATSGQISYWNGTSTQTGSANLTTDGSYIRVGNGSAATPTFSFVSDPDTGMYAAVANTLSFATGGTIRAFISTSQFSITPQLVTADGSAAAPAHSFGTDPNTGMYSVGADSLGFAAGGVLQLTVNTSGLTVATGLISPGASFTGTVANTQGYTSGTGTVGAPAYSFGSDTNTGMYRPAADTLSFACGGVLQLNLTTAAASFTGNLDIGGFFTAPSASSANPTYSFTGDTNTGMYGVGADILGFATGATLRMFINTSTVIVSSGTAFRLGNNAVAETPTATHTMVIQDATGTSYRVLCLV